MQARRTTLTSVLATQRGRADSDGGLDFGVAR